MSEGLYNENMKFSEAIIKENTEIWWTLSNDLKEPQGTYQLLISIICNDMK